MMVVIQLPKRVVSVQAHNCLVNFTKDVISYWWDSSNSCTLGVVWTHIWDWVATCWAVTQQWCWFGQTGRHSDREGQRSQPITLLLHAYHTTASCSPQWRVPATCMSCTVCTATLHPELWQYVLRFTSYFTCIARRLCLHLMGRMSNCCCWYVRRKWVLWVT